MEYTKDPAFQTKRLININAKITNPTPSKSSHPSETAVITNTILLIFHHPSKGLFINLINAFYRPCYFIIIC